jgi:hypothetical protein
MTKKTAKNEISYKELLISLFSSPNAAQREIYTKSTREIPIREF